MNNSVYAFSKANPSLPVFSMTATAIGYWAIGGYVPQYAGIGQNMAEQAYLYCRGQGGYPLQPACRRPIRKEARL